MRARSIFAAVLVCSASASLPARADDAVQAKQLFEGGIADLEPDVAEAEVACLKSGAVKETPDLVRVEPISGPGVCGAEYPLKVAALGESSGSFGFADELRPPCNIGNQPRWPVSQPPAPRPQQTYPNTYSNGAVRQQGYGTPSSGPISLSAPGVVQQHERASR